MALDCSSDLLVVSPQFVVKLQVARKVRGIQTQSFSSVLGSCVSSDTLIVQWLKSDREGVGMGVGGIKCFRSCCHCEPLPKNTGSFDDKGSDKVRLSIHRLWLTKDRGEAGLCCGSPGSTDTPN